MRESNRTRGLLPLGLAVSCEVLGAECVPPKQTFVDPSVPRMGPVGGEFFTEVTNLQEGR